MAAADATKVHIGQGDVWIGGTAPAAGTDPTSPINGTPSALNAFTTAYAAPTSGGTYVGFTNGPATLTYRPTFYGVTTEQAFADVITTPTAEEATLGFTMLESSYANLTNAFGQGTGRVVGSGTLSNTLYLGGRPDTVVKVVTMLSRKRTGVGYYVLTVYQGYNSEGVSINYEKRAETRIPVTIRALADVTRPQGDQLFQLVEYPVSPP